VIELSFIGKITPTRGALIKLKDTLEFIRQGKDVLKMKRDRLAGELNDQIRDLESRKALEAQLMRVYEKAKDVLTNLGYETVAANARAVSYIEAEVTRVSVMGVALPKIAITKKPSLDSIRDMSIHHIAEELQTLIVDLLSLAQTEASIEGISHELMLINRKVNALERTVIPEYERKISYIQDLLFDEDLEGFAQIKHIKNVTGRRRT
jgi:H(+)-transporting ATP synthase subunit D